MKVHIEVAAGSDGAERQRICWYAGTSDAQVEMAVRVQLRLPCGARFLLRDSDGDVVPVSATLPSNQFYTLVLPEPASSDAESAGTEESAVRYPTAPSSTRKRSEPGDGSTATSCAANLPASTSPCSRPKRRKMPPPVRVGRISSPSPLAEGGDTLRSSPQRLERPVPAPRPWPIANVVTQFLETFTQPIAHDDNVNFIPSTGQFALYALYSELFPHASCHPKGQDVFYKMTSLHGKVDRQRVIRYYRFQPPDAHAPEDWVRSVPQGKGLLLRRFRVVEGEAARRQLRQEAQFVTHWALDPDDVVRRYLRFVRGFTPVCKTDFQAHRNRRDGVP